MSTSGKADFEKDSGPAGRSPLSHLHRPGPAVSQTTRQLLEDVQASLHEAIAGDAILKSYSEETQKHFATIIKSPIDDALTRPLTVAQGRMDEWVKKTLDHSMAEGQKALTAANDDSRNGRMEQAALGLNRRRADRLSTPPGGRILVGPKLVPLWVMCLSASSRIVTISR